MKEDKYKKEERERNEKLRDEIKELMKDLGRSYE